MSAKEFVSIRVSTLRGDAKIPFDVFVKVVGKHILYCRKGDSFEGMRLTRLREKKLKKMFIPMEHDNLYRTYLQENIDAAYDQAAGKPIEMRAQIIQGAQQAAAEEVMENPTDQKHYEATKSNMARYVDFLKKENDALKSIIQIDNLDQNVAQHCVTVAAMAVSIAEKMGGYDANMINLIGLGAMVHDLEHSHSGVNLGTPRDQMDAATKELYQQHPLKGVERIQSAEFFDRTVINIILQHEEFLNGTGFPKGLRENQIDPVVWTVSTANAFDRYVSFERVAPKDALKKLLIDKMGLFPLNYLQAMQEVLKEKSVI